MNAADAQATGVGGLLVLAGGVIAACARGGWAVFRDWSSRSSAKNATTQTHAEKVTELAQEGLMALNRSLSEDNADLRKRIVVLESALEAEQVKSGLLAEELRVVRATATTLETTVGDLSSRLARLEGGHGAE